MSGYVEYSHNNSGGNWWLTEKNWRDLEKAGWEVEWGALYFCGERYSWTTPKRPVYEFAACDEGKCKGHRIARTYAEAKRAKVDYMGAMAKRAIRRGLSMRDAAAEWERVTGLDATDAGCACCGQPHYFTEYDGAGQCVADGPEARWEASW